ncbi:Mu homology domain-containing protein [Lentinula aciculospora]|uniref:Mu homology domain-containing protein n=1 Tax=Lentinula aciculospora TaxID=153920 RepID=A0A9W9DIE7_9AGAR|nr:Mu homology domain-containing protein [Lentinula aciculospora]
MALDGIIILDHNGRPIIQSGFRSNTTAYPLLHIDAVNNALQKAERSADVDPVIYVTPYNTTAISSACCHVEVGDLRFLCPVSGDVDPLLAFAFLQTFIDILREYLGTVSAATLRDNFDIVYQLFEETLDSGGHPLTTYSNALRDIVIPPSLLNKLLSVTGTNFNSTINSGFGAGAAAGPFSSPLPWRKTGVRYNNNEIYFDIVEQLKAIVNKHGVVVSSNVHGKIEANAKLSGTPDCSLNFTNPQVLLDCALHPCVRLLRWNRDKILSFVPPDGRFTLMDYTYSALPSPLSAQQSLTSAMSSRNNLALPFIIKAIVELEDSGGSFDITLTSRDSTHALEKVVAEMHLGQGAVGIRCSVSRGIGGGGFVNAGRSRNLDTSGMSSGASWSFDAQQTVLRWEIPIVSPSSSWSLHGSFSTTNRVPRPSHAIRVRFDISSHTYSALKVGQLKVTDAKENYKPYKGVRGRSSGEVEWRW